MTNRRPTTKRTPQPPPVAASTPYEINTIRNSTQHRHIGRHRTIKHARNSTPRRLPCSAWPLPSPQQLPLLPPPVRSTSPCHAPQPHRQRIDRERDIEPAPRSSSLMSGDPSCITAHGFCPFLVSSPLRLQAGHFFSPRTTATQTTSQSFTPRTTATQTMSRSLTLRTTATQTTSRSLTLHTTATQTMSRPLTLHTTATQTTSRSLFTPCTIAAQTRSRHFFTPASL
ncbi:hypothetical protein VKT23_008596 [Stygiomarasmius scandens]|uniref:Uncharacterized protein n=1 Tax=Marasmiellus scandens TaxID=2682957 RepID=A0ABR1JJN8_9AGAR